ncbi:MAG: aminotransferase class III-fold pyridoxal phosphate-dependent enzyme [Paracoccaceae bacterium]|nr:aminotransferase class III-fold pyridoxal phosphate-dependent enzyme [Paracoccaceae bacterium]
MSDISELMHRRERLLGPNVPTFYETPLHIVRGKGVWLWDADGRRYLDCYNNVPHVGHCHPAVVEAIARQSAQLNTHTRYLHEGILDYIEALTTRFGANITSAIMTCTGSEANDVALRMAQAATGRTGIIATDRTYHGNTAAVSQLSTRRPPVGGRRDHVRLVPAPDSLRNPDPEGRSFAAAVEQAIAELEDNGHGLSALVICPFFANEGFPDLPRGFLDRAADAVRKAGGIIIADEVQPGFGRLGSHWWGHQRLGFTPDIVTIGKPMANGYPAAAVLSSLELLSEFRNAFGYFNTFGGNPVACAAASAVLEVIERENLIEAAHDTGKYALERLRGLAKKYPVIADVRGAGLFFGVEFTIEGGSPATAFTARVVEEMKSRGILLNSIGPGNATLKIRPPMVFGKEHADLLIDALDDILATTAVRE